MIRVILLILYLVRYHERDRIIKSENKADKWAAFMSFLNELYALVSLTILTPFKFSKRNSDQILSASSPLSLILMHPLDLIWTVS